MRAVLVFVGLLAAAAASGERRQLGGGYYAWKSKCVGFELLKGDGSGVVSYGQINMQQIYTNDMYANSSQWNVKLGDPSVPGPFYTRADARTNGDLYSCPDADPAVSCFNPVGPTNCVICSKSMALGMAMPSSWLRPQGQMAWFIDSLPFPHTSLAWGNITAGLSFNTDEMYGVIKFDAYATPAAKSVPYNISIWVESKDDVTNQQRLTLEAPEFTSEADAVAHAAALHAAARKLQSDKPDYVLTFSPVVNDRCAWRPL